MTVNNISFVEGGVLLNGIHAGEPAGSLVQTPPLPRFNFDGFAIQADFKVDAYPNRDMPLFVGGISFRWIAYYLTIDGTVAMWHGNNMNKISSDALYLPDSLHQALIVYDGTMARFYLDGVEAGSAAFPIVHGDDKNVIVFNPANGDTYAGIFGNLQIYSDTGRATPIEYEPGLPVTFALDQNYPNPFNPSTTIQYSVPATGPVRLAVYNLLGREVAVLVDATQAPGTYRVTLDAAGWPSGVYLYRITTNEEVCTRYFTLLK